MSINVVVWRVGYGLIVLYRHYALKMNRMGLMQEAIFEEVQRIV